MTRQLVDRAGEHRSLTQTPEMLQPGSYVDFLLAQYPNENTRRAQAPARPLPELVRGLTLYLLARDLERDTGRAHHADTRTKQLYDHSDYDITLEDVELVQF